MRFYRRGFPASRPKGEGNADKREFCLFKEENSMKRKLSLLAVLIAMLSLVLFITACGGDENVASATSIPERTITIYAITGKTTTAEAVASVQAAMNKITESKFKTHVVLKLFDEDAPLCGMYRPHFDFLCFLKQYCQVASNLRKMSVLSSIF